MKHLITFRTRGVVRRMKAFVEAEGSLEDCLQRFKEANPDTYSHCIYNKDHLETEQPSEDAFDVAVTSLWQAKQRLEARNYTNSYERQAFLAGYSDGYHGYEMFAGNERDWYPNAYTAGYWEGKADAKDH